MKPKNNKERRNSILKFSVLFIFTIGLIVFAFFFDFDRVPLKIADHLMERSKAIEKEMEFQEQFSNNMSEIQSLIDTLDTPDLNYRHYNAMIDTKIVDLQKSIPVKDSTYRFKMYNDIVNSYADLHDYRNKLKELEDVEIQLEDYKEELEKVKEDLLKANEYIQVLQNSRR
ncbi:type VI secretion system TssO [Aquimarina algicola]|uniref:Type VI secretion system transmembrane protein TssO n=1 Tax=Aquimarina algicola TaxID=2589995 RepID=A0A504IY52_9FLAO|nr:type VI secretion system TssO [Aquimarina algicola]TPN81245.1 hypothetical protein FHK87_25000 [Aquimarina algicola]